MEEGHVAATEPGGFFFFFRSIILAFSLWKTILSPEGRQTGNGKNSVPPYLFKLSKGGWSLHIKQRIKNAAILMLPRCKQTT